MPATWSRTYDQAQRPWWQKDGVTLGNGHDRAPGRTDVRAKHHAGGAGRRSCRDHRSQMVHVGADVRCFLVLAQRRAA